MKKAATAVLALSIVVIFVAAGCGFGADRTSSQDGLWSDSATWGGQTPPDSGDSVIINHVVDYDADINGSGLTGLTINGTLRMQDAQIAAGTYHLSLASSITLGGSGSWLIGSSEAQPLSPDRRLIVDLKDGSASFSGLSGLTIKAYPAQPAQKWVRIDAAEASGDEVLATTGGPAPFADWPQGATVAVVNYGLRTDNSTEYFTVQGASGNRLSLSEELVAAKIAGSMLVLIDRNISIINPATGSEPLFDSFGINKLVMGFAIPDIKGITTGPVIFKTSGVTVLAPIAQQTGTGATKLINVCDGVLIKGALVGTSNRDVNGIEGLANATVTEPLLGLNWAMALIRGANISAPIIGSAKGLSSVSGTYVGKEISFCDQAVRYADLDMYGTKMVGNTSGVEYLEDKLVNMEKSVTRSFDHGQVPGNTQTWASGGVCATDFTDFPPGYTHSIKMTMEATSADIIFDEVSAPQARYEEEYIVRAGQTLTIAGAVKHDTPGMVWRPRIRFIDPADDPMMSPAGDALEEHIAGDSAGEWESFRLSWQNNTAGDKRIVVRFVGSNAWGHAWAAWQPVA